MTMKTNEELMAMVVALSEQVKSTNETLVVMMQNQQAMVQEIANLKANACTTIAVVDKSNVYKESFVETGIGTATNIVANAIGTTANVATEVINVTANVSTGLLNGIVGISNTLINESAKTITDITNFTGNTTKDAVKSTRLTVEEIRVKYSLTDKYKG